MLLFLSVFRTCTHDSFQVGGERQNSRRDHRFPSGFHRDLKVVYIVKGETIMANIKYALFGATGTVGKALAAKLAERGQRFRVVGRSEERLRQTFGGYEPLVEYCAANLSDPASAARAAAGVDTIFYTVGVPYPQFAQHPKLSRVALEAAAGAGVRHFVHLSTVYPYGVPQQEFVSESHPRNPTAFKGRMRKEQKTSCWLQMIPKGCERPSCARRISTGRTRN